MPKFSIQTIQGQALNYRRHSIIAWCNLSMDEACPHTSVKSL